MPLIERTTGLTIRITDKEGEFIETQSPESQILFGILQILDSILSNLEVLKNAKEKKD